MLWKSIAQDKGCLPLDLLILNVALAFFSAILAVVAFFQLVRIHLREKEWTRQKVLHFMIGTSNTGYFIYFASTHFSTYEKWLCWYHVCGFVLMGTFSFLVIIHMQLQYLFSAGCSNDEHTAAAYPKILVDLCHQANDEEDDDGENSTQQTLLANSTNKFGSSNTDGNWACCSFQNLHVGSCQNFVVAVVLLVFIVMVSFAMIIWIGARENFINSSIVAQILSFARSKEGIFVNQGKYIFDLLRETGLLHCKAAETPIDANLQLDLAKSEDVIDREKFQRLVGKLIYLLHTRLDIAFAVSMVSQFMHAPGQVHFDAAYRILRYLKGTLGKGLMFRRQNDLQIEVYTDADWAGSPTDRRSTSGYCTFIRGNLATWRSKK
ncbi:hypothetical protein L484_021372 [Morus notabilis]|uniref:Reverse transcriptase Ty1/copia-type domain-containing protein n=1 Tax=Morus notabilis TaxID=981085 RepID=W9RHD1_9ROSA|nr:hypothetical protein L484_021372 [Morus notabilis]